MKSWTFLPFLVILAGCDHSGGSANLDGRPLVPPTSGVTVGSLYYVREAPTFDTSSPARLERLCTVNLAKYGIATSAPTAVADIDFSQTLELSGSLTGLSASFATLGLTGSVKDYYEYKLTNAKHVDITPLEADRIFESRAFDKDCRGWRQNIAKKNWGKYQIIGITYGDLTFGPKRDLTVSPEVTLKLAGFTPTLKSTMSRHRQDMVTGKGLVVTFQPLPRD